ncbi:MAG: hypothetical protein ABSF83_03305 [Nitrososphaerales archaeon]
MERPNKPNLFSRGVQEGVLYADLQGTEVVPIWDAPCPYLYFFAHVDTHVSKDEERRILKAEFKRLSDNDCPARSSFYQVSEPDGLFFGDDEISDQCL